MLGMVAKVFISMSNENAYNDSSVLRHVVMRHSRLATVPMRVAVELLSDVVDA